ncbi:DUF1641 domain-containing protein [Mycolicibacterium iranicum]|uniref:DUF1641 domain-containing protein n=1 Tax=Mycolicibacterium iranicum TaxID=912594 RepID=A0A178LJ10_MYCIR|nr:DUF1641 domain-containing protein [Mycolicibacterium iranicum]OAN30058.1 hypothetical protein A4X20_09250 [Mycolicibacterium iranicum]
MVANGHVVEASPADLLRERLEDPAVAASLNALLDHADLLAVLVVGLDGMVRRGDEISESLSSAVGELRGPAASLPGLSQARAEFGSIDVSSLVVSLAGLTRALVDTMPVLNKLLHSPLADPRAAEVLADIGAALVEGERAAHAHPDRPKGLFGLWRVSKDRDINRGLGFLIHVARAFGRQLPE